VIPLGLVSFNQVVMSISRPLLYCPLWTVIPLPEREDGDACLSPMPECSARQQRLGRWQAPLDGICLLEVSVEHESARLQLTATAPTAACPRCAVLSASVWGRLSRRRIFHRPWPLCRVERPALMSTMLESQGLPTPRAAPLMHVQGEPLRVGIWPPERR
jgi:hypothetical protein